MTLPQARTISDPSDEGHFAFGENWADFAKTVDEKRIGDAMNALARLLPDLAGQSFLDIGCGSGLSSLAALCLGAASVYACDVDPHSVATTGKLLRRFAPHDRWVAELRSVFDLDMNRDGQFDVVYAWGVLHHTGDMWRSLKSACALVKPSGRLAVALYRKTPLCGIWRIEKRLYSKSPHWLQTVACALFRLAHGVAFIAAGRNPFAFARNYHILGRGMSWRHDVHDWLGGYPYQSASPEDVDQYLCRLGFILERRYGRRPRLFGLFGVSCEEYIYRGPESRSGKLASATAP
jgi:SAM-dependent methyltransferase